MDNYLSHYGWHFSKRMAEWAISMMHNRNGEPIKPKEKDTLHELLKANGISTEKIIGYDAVYVEAMARSDFFGSSLPTEQHIFKYISDYLNDKDGYDEIAFTRFCADMGAKGIPIYWEEML